MDQPLPDDLKQALEASANFWERRARETVLRDRASTPLFHYTVDEAALHGILRDGIMRFSDVRKLNDEVELTYGLRLFRKVIRRLDHANLPALARMFVKPMRAERFRRRLFDRFSFFSASFGRADDLRMWDDYASCGRGFALGFSTDLFNSDKDIVGAPLNERYFMGKVGYEAAAALREHTETIEHHLGLIPTTMRGPEPAKQLFRELASNAHIPVIWTSLTTKEPKWSHENETRLLVVQDKRAKEKHRIFRPRRPYIEMRIPKSCFTEIVLGPRRTTEISEVKALLTAYGYSMPVNRSRHTGR